jgi:hypothetical protein
VGFIAAMRRAAGDVERDDVGLRHHRFDGVARLGGEVEAGHRRAVVVDHPHAEARLGATGGGLADPAHADDADRLALKAHAEPLGGTEAVPVAVAQRLLGLAEPPGGRDHQPDGEVGGCVGEHVRGVRDRDTRLLRRLEVDVVHPDAEVRDDAGRARRPHQELAVDAFGDGGEHAVGLVEGGRYAFARERGVPGVEGAGEVLAQARLDGVGQLAADDDARRHQ